MTFNRSRAADRRTRFDDLVLEATYRKTLVLASKLASFFELLYAIQPLIFDDLYSLLPPSVLTSVQSINKASDRINLMLRKEMRELGTRNLVPHLHVYF